MSKRNIYVINVVPHLDTALVDLDLGAVLDLGHHHAAPLLHLLTFHTRKQNLFDDAGLLWLGQLDTDWLHYWHQLRQLLALVSG